MLVHTRREVHAGRRGYHAAARETVYCRRLNAKRAREYAHEKRHSARWWKHYYSPRQVAKRKRAAKKAERRYRLLLAREERYLGLAGRKWVAYPKCPDTARIRHKAQEKKAREKRDKARAECRKARAAASAARAIKSSRSSKAGKSRKSSKAKSGRTKC